MSQEQLVLLTEPTKRDRASGIDSDYGVQYTGPPPQPPPTSSTLFKHLQSRSSRHEKQGGGQHRTKQEVENPKNRCQHSFKHIFTSDHRTISMTPLKSIEKTTVLPRVLNIKKVKILSRKTPWLCRRKYNRVVSIVLPFACSVQFPLPSFSRGASVLSFLYHSYLYDEVPLHPVEYMLVFLSFLLNLSQICHK